MTSLERLRTSANDLSGRTGRIGHKGLASSFYNERNEDIASVLTRTLLETNQVIPDFLESYVPEGDARKNLKFEADSDWEGSDAGGADGADGGGGGAWGGGDGGAEGAENTAWGGGATESAAPAANAWGGGSGNATDAAPANDAWGGGGAQFSW